MATAVKLGRFKMRDGRISRIHDEGRYQALAAADVSRMINEALGAGVELTPGDGSLEAGMRLIEEGKRAMVAFKAASKARWGGGTTPVETETRDRQTIAMDRFKAHSAARHRKR